VGRLECCLGDRSGDFVLAAQKWLANINPTIEPYLRLAARCASRER
jgi:hypothetical protein